MIAYNLFLLLSTKDRVYLFYVSNVAAYFLLDMSTGGIGFQYFWSDTPFFQEKSPIIFTFFVTVTGILFNREFLKVYYQNHPKVDRLLLSQAALSVIGIILAFFYSSRVTIPIISLTAIITIPIGIVATLQSIRMGYRPAKYYLIAWSSLAIASIASVFQVWGIIPYNLWTENCVQIGTTLEVILLALALADRINLMKKQLEENNLELARHDKLKDEFLANTSHELRTPLNAIIGISEAAQNKGNLPENHQSDLSLIIASGRRLSLLVNDILDYAKLRHKEIVLQRIPVNLTQVVDSVVALSSGLLKEKDLQLCNEVGDETPLVLADENRLVQIFQNLIGNAIKFTPSGTVRVLCHRVEKSLKVIVADTGVGIPEKDQNRIFESFEQADGSETREYGGTGIGLTVTKQLVELHGSELNVYSEVGRGSEFSFSLPITDSETQPANKDVFPLKSQPQQSVSYIPNRVEGLQKLLVIDDDPLNLHVIRSQMESSRYSVITAESGMKGIDLVEQQKPDLILLDIMMPHMSGFEVCEKLRNQHSTEQLPIIFLTAKNKEEDIVKGLELGGNDYLPKPFFYSELEKRVQNHVQLSLNYKRTKALTQFSNKIHEFSEVDKMMGFAFNDITDLGFFDHAAVFKQEEVFLSSDEAFCQKPPNKEVLAEMDIKSQQRVIFNHAKANDLISKQYGEGHFAAYVPADFEEYLFLFHRLPERPEFHEHDELIFIQNVVNQVKASQSNIQLMVKDPKLLVVAAKIQPRITKIVAVKSVYPNLQLYFSDKKEEEVDGCSLENLCQYFSDDTLLRVHKSWVINPQFVKMMDWNKRSKSASVNLSGGLEVPIGRKHVESVAKKLNYLG